MSSRSTTDRVLVTGAGGFVGGHIARWLAGNGWSVRALTRSKPNGRPGDPDLEWITGDLRNPGDRKRALSGCRRVIHAASWVSLGADPSGESSPTNVTVTREFLAECAAGGVERFVYTSTLWTVARGTAETPAHEGSAWNLDCVRCPYCDSKRAAEQLVLEADKNGIGTLALCPGLVVGSRDEKPTSTRLLLEMARTPVAVLPPGGIPVVDARVLAMSHEQALQTAETGRRLVIAGPYRSYHEMARTVAKVARRPRFVLPVPAILEQPLSTLAGVAARLCNGHGSELSKAAVAGGFLRLHVSGQRADHEFGLVHPPLEESIFEALEDHRRSGRASWLRLREPM